MGEPLVVLLGGTGLVGTAVRRELEPRPVRLRVVGRRRVMPATARAAEVDLRCQDLTLPGTVEQIVADADVVISLAAYSDQRRGWRGTPDHEGARAVNVGTIERVIDAARSAPRPPAVVFSGSASQGRSTQSPSGEVAAPARTTYDEHKLIAERCLLDAHREGVVRSVSLRFTTLVADGPESLVNDRGVMATMIRRARARQHLAMWHDGSVVRDLLAVTDAAAAVVAAVDSLATVEGGWWDVGSGVGVTVRELFVAVAQGVAAESGDPAVPVVREPPPDHAVTGDAEHVRVDPRPFTEATGWRSRISWREALAGALEPTDTAPTTTEPASEPLGTGRGRVKDSRARLAPRQ